MPIKQEVEELKSKFDRLVSLQDEMNTLISEIGSELNDVDSRVNALCADIYDGLEATNRAEVDPTAEEFRRLLEYLAERLGAIDGATASPDVEFAEEPTTVAESPVEMVLSQAEINTFRALFNVYITAKASGNSTRIRNAKISVQQKLDDEPAYWSQLPDTIVNDFD